METEHNDFQKEKISRKGIRLFLMLQVVLLVIVFLSLLQSGEYGWTLFCIVPFSLGMTAGIYTRTYHSRKIVKGLFWSLLILCSVCLLLLVAGVEGVICILMAAGIIFLPGLAGMFVGYLIRNAHRIYGLVLILFLNSSAYVYDRNDTDQIESVARKSITINAPKEKVWSILTHTVNYTSHENFFFKAGVSYPEAMQLMKQKGKCFLACRLNNGLVDLPVIELDSMKRFRFTMPPDIAPMKEMTPYDSIHAEHLKGYFLPQYGEFKITPLNQKQCILTAETSYTYKITPVFYWRWWSDYLVNTMHEHVLENIRELSEEKK